MRRRLNKKTIYVLVLIFVLFLSYLSSVSFRAVEDFYSYKRAMGIETPLTLKRFLFFFKKELKYEKEKFLAKKPLEDDESPLTTFRITVKQKDLESLNENLPKSGKDHFVKGYLKISDDPKIRKIEFRYRGDNNFHWLYPQKSLRIKLLGDDIFNMEKSFNLINPPNWYSFRDVVVYEFAKKLGLLSPDFFPVRVFINGKFMGVYLYLSQVDESLLRKFKRMPGSIYYGDYGEPDKNGVSTLWRDPDNWVKKAARNAEQKYDRSDINYLIYAVNYFDDKEFYDFFNEMANKERFYTFFALDVIFGSNHHDFHHNHKIYFDPYLGRYEPIEWDLRMWSDEKVKDLSVYPLLNRVRLNPVLEAERDKRAYEILKSLDFSPKKIMERYKEVAKEVKRDLESDYFKDTAIINPEIFDDWVSVPFTVEEFEKGVEEDGEILKRRFEFLKRVYEDARVSYKIDGEKVIFKVEGNSPAVIEVGGEKRVLYPGRKILKGAQTTRPKLLYGNDLIVNAPMFYEFYRRDIKDFKAYNYITKHEIAVKREDFKIERVSDSADPSLFGKREKRRVVFEGEVDLNETKVFRDDVFIKEGTKFRLNEGVSLYFLGDLEINGTKENPVVFEPMFEAKPWGIVGVWSKKAKIRFANVRGGSIDQRNLVHFTAPFSFHAVKDLNISGIKVFRNYKGDDAMHIAYSRASVENSLFKNARSDGLDIDISNVKIKNCRFINSGNDGLDVMTTNISVENSFFKNNKDKGISVGEWSKLLLKDSVFIGNVIGLEIKDKSEVFAKNIDIACSGNMAIHLYNKNPRYDEGGYLKGEGIRLFDNKRNVIKDYKSLYEANFKILSGYNCFEKKDPKIYEQKGHVLFAEGKYEEALENFKKSIEFSKDEDNGTISKRYRYYANVLYLLGKKKEAVRNFASALAYDPSNKNAFYPLVNIFKEIKSDKELYEFLLNFKINTLKTLFDKVIKRKVFYFNFYEDGWSKGKEAKAVIFSDGNELKKMKYFILNGSEVEVYQDKNLILKSFVNTSEPQYLYFEAKEGFTELTIKSSKSCIPKKCGFNDDLRELGVHVKIEDLTFEEKRDYENGVKYFYVNYYDDHFAKGKRSGVWVYGKRIGERVFLRYTANDLPKKPFFVTVRKNFRFYDKIKLKPKEIRFEEIGLDTGNNFIELKSDEDFSLELNGKERKVSLKYKILRRK